MTDYCVTESIDEVMERWLDNDMNISERWKDISKTMDGIAHTEMCHDMRKRFREAPDSYYVNEDSDHKFRIQGHWLVTKEKYIRYREIFMAMDFSEDKESRIHRDILERALAQDAERILFDTEDVEF